MKYIVNIKNPETMLAIVKVVGSNNVCQLEEAQSGVINADKLITGINTYVETHDDIAIEGTSLVKYLIAKGILK